MAGETSGEFRGRTIEAAISAGLAALQLSREDVEVEVIRPGSRGVLGIGAEDAVIRLTDARPGAVRPVVAPAPQPIEASKPEAKPEPKPASRPEPKPEPAPASKSQPRSEPNRTPDDAAGALNPKALAAAELGQTFLSGLLDRMGLRATVEIVAQSSAEADEDERTPVLNIVGDDLGVLIGRQNETLSAIEYITRLAVNQQSHSRSQFTVDVNGYRAKRAESLRKLAFRMADQCAQSGRTVALEPMPPAERRIIHMALRDHPKVFTQSVGEGDRRKVTVVLKKDA
jgi:spoIIIJ-associated protein